MPDLGGQPPVGLPPLAPAPVGVAAQKPAPLIVVPVSGPAGPRGPAGSGVVYTQTATAATWIITHGLGRRVSTTVLDELNRIVEPDIEQPDIATVVITWPSPRAGSVILT